MATAEPDPDMAAAELALGLLDGAERATALRRSLAEPAFAREVEAWRLHFGALFAAWPTAEPSPGLFARIEQRIDGAAEGGRTAAPAPIRGWAWKAATAASSLIAACLLVALLIRPGQPPVLPPEPLRPLVASLAPTGAGKAGSGQAGPVAAVYDRAAGEIRLAAIDVAPAGKSAELWAIGGDGVPRAIGLIGAAQPTSLPLTAGLRAQMAAGLTLAISIEPHGGSPTGKPTGPVVAAGALIQA